ncbi:phosphonate C-P lyase system protein PhnH [Bacillus sp. Bva_UNVM-123]|uniref:phosphonate C-P lyase system protein PhnH n=1 Tax=Bacillus sp. Bva_UNVM-123 TaxID=2829798 RepID=UPI00391F3303
MKLDIVHDLQSVYRDIVSSTARPGTLSNLEKYAEKVEVLRECPKSIVLLAFTLLDQEVTFNVYSAQEEIIKRQMNQFTYAKAAAVEEADYIFVMGDAPTGSLEKAIQQAKVGSLRNPHESATVIAEVEMITNEEMLYLKGPGIQERNQISVSSSEDWVAIRERKNAQYPLGIDLLFIDRQHKLLCLPRTTQIRKQVKDEWAM